MSPTFRYGVKANFEPYFLEKRDRDVICHVNFVSNVFTKKNVYFQARLLEPTQILKPQTLCDKIKTKFESN